MKKKMKKGKVYDIIFKPRPRTFRNVKFIRETEKCIVVKTNYPREELGFFGFQNEYMIPKKDIDKIEKVKT